MANPKHLCAADRQRAARRALLAKLRGIDGSASATEIVVAVKFFKGKCRKCRARGHKSSACPLRNTATDTDIVVGKTPRVTKPTKSTWKQRRTQKPKVKRGVKAAKAAKKAAKKAAEQMPEKPSTKLSKAAKRKARKQRSDLMAALEGMMICS